MLRDQHTVNGVETTHRVSFLKRTFFPVASVLLIVGTTGKSLILCIISHLSVIDRTDQFATASTMRRPSALRNTSFHSKDPTSTLLAIRIYICCWRLIYELCFFSINEILSVVLSVLFALLQWPFGGDGASLWPTAQDRTLGVEGAARLRLTPSAETGLVSSCWSW